MTGDSDPRSEGSAPLRLGGPRSWLAFVKLLPRELQTDQRLIDLIREGDKDEEILQYVRAREREYARATAAFENAHPRLHRLAMQWVPRGGGGYRLRQRVPYPEDEDDEAAWEAWRQSLRNPSPDVEAELDWYYGELAKINAPVAAIMEALRYYGSKTRRRDEDRD